ncbi:glycosyltransferase family 4 protein [Solirubrum puertoriconensis]|uniref:glycosyltransferase family 4 protein n=1 Tax=Solirubrum puertoriconensis TaxID=1751427 RepID=UPI000AA68872|nr:glycosyltransferase family 4 protein [Solirubrum puertoriconensis]
MQIVFPAKILMTADAVGGMWTYALELANALGAHGTHVHLATMGTPLSDAQSQEAAAIPNLTVHESAYKLEWMEEPWEDIARAGEWLLQLRDEIQPDLIHLNGTVHGNLPWGKPVLAVVHSCALSWWQAVRGEQAPNNWATYRRMVQAGLQAADVVVAPTHSMLSQAEAFYGPFRQQAVVPHGRTQENFRVRVKEPLIFGMGRLWDEAENLEVLARVASLPWPVYLAGDAQHPVTGETMQLDNVHFLGCIAPAEAADWLSRASIFVLPAKYEPFGLTILEAAMSGCALVLGDIPSLREVWGDAAQYVKPTEAKGLEAVIECLMIDEMARNRLALRAAARSQNYTTARMVEAYGALYEQLLASAAAVMEAPGLGAEASSTSQQTAAKLLSSSLASA